VSLDPFVSYAPEPEDVVLARALHPDDRGGFWVERRCGDPVLDSVTARSPSGMAGRERGTAPARTRAALRGTSGGYESAGRARANGRADAFVEPAEPRERPDPDARSTVARPPMVLELAARYGADGQEFTPIEVLHLDARTGRGRARSVSVDFLK